MTKNKTAARTTRRTRTAKGHAHKPGRCLDLLKQLSAYIDDELPSDICREIRRHVGACPNCETFIASLRRTVNLCRHQPTPPLTAADRVTLRETILRTARAKSV